MFDLTTAAGERAVLNSSERAVVMDRGMGRIFELFAGVSWLKGDTFGRVVGIIAASIGAIGALLAVGGAYPFWALGVFAICLICIHGLVVYGDDVDEARG
jgi:hypothetical protein